MLFSSYGMYPLSEPTYRVTQSVGVLCQRLGKSNLPSTHAYQGDHYILDIFDTILHVSLNKLHGTYICRVLEYS